MNTTSDADVLAQNATVVKCRFHGPKCEDPDRCERFRPKKYEGDGNLETIDPDRLQVGHVIRSNFQKDGRLSAFSDSVVLAIRVYPKQGDHARSYDTLGQAMAEAKKNGGYVAIRVARPYLYEHLGSPLMGCENYEQDVRILDNYRVVVGSTGEYDRRTATFSIEYHEVREAERREEARKRKW
jgi:hypothetical protein